MMAARPSPRRSRLEIWGALILWAVAVGAVGCAGPPEPVARVEVGVDRLDLPHGGWTDLELSWFPLRSLEGPPAEPVVFVHLLDGSKRLVRTFDVPYPWPWQPGVERIHRVRVLHSALAPPLEPGRYSLTAGLYDPATGARWPLAVEADVVGRLEYSLAAVEVPGPPPAAEFSLDGDVTEVEGGEGLQIPARVRLTGAATVRVGPVAAAGTVLLQLTVQERALLEGEVDLGRVTVTGSCGCPEVVVSAAGGTQLELALWPEPEPGACAVRLEPDDQLLAAMALDRRAVWISGLAWRPDA